MTFWKVCELHIIFYVVLCRKRQGCVTTPWTMIEGEDVDPLNYLLISTQIHWIIFTHTHTIHIMHIPMGHDALLLDYVHDVCSVIFTRFRTHYHCYLITLIYYKIEYIDYVIRCHVWYIFLYFQCCFYRCSELIFIKTFWFIRIEHNIQVIRYCKGFKTNKMIYR